MMWLVNHNQDIETRNLTNHEKHTYRKRKKKILREAWNFNMKTLLHPSFLVNFFVSILTDVFLPIMCLFLSWWQQCRSAQELLPITLLWTIKQLILNMSWRELDLLECPMRYHISFSSYFFSLWLDSLSRNLSN